MYVPTAHDGKLCGFSEKYVKAIGVTTQKTTSKMLKICVKSQSEAELANSKIKRNTSTERNPIPDCGIGFGGAEAAAGFAVRSRLAYLWQNKYEKYSIIKII